MQDVNTKGNFGREEREYMVTSVLPAQDFCKLRIALKKNQAS